MAKKTPAKKVAKKTPAKKVAKKTPAKTVAPRPLGFRDLAPWTRRPLDPKLFDLLAATNGSIGYEDCFGGDPAFVMVYDDAHEAIQDVVLDGWKAAADAQQTVYVIGGDFGIEGTMVFDQSDIMTVLWVRGNLRANRLILGSTAVLIVDGALWIDGEMVTDLEDAGHLIVHERVVARAWIDLSRGRGCIEIKDPPRIRFLSDYYAEQAKEDGAEDEEEGEGEARLRPRDFACAPASPAVLPGLRDGDEIDRRKLIAALRKGSPILA